MLLVLVHLRCVGGIFTGGQHHQISIYLSIYLSISIYLSTILVRDPVQSTVGPTRYPGCRRGTRWISARSDHGSLGSEEDASGVAVELPPAEIAP